MTERHGEVGTALLKGRRRRVFYADPNSNTPWVSTTKDNYTWLSTHELVDYRKELDEWTEPPTLEEASQAISAISESNDYKPIEEHLTTLRAFLESL